MKVPVGAVVVAGGLVADKMENAEVVALVPGGSDNVQLIEECVDPDAGVALQP
ncbi:MAG: hypothetical protein JRM95_00285 [Nitrososphaerota archaeon]|nr:hypothetical protein [Nitrososphaerota archaeon]